MKNNKSYWEMSLKNPEPETDKYYISDEIIVDNPKFTKEIERLRELIRSYCEIAEKDKNSASEILDEICKKVMSVDKIQYTEFIAFWKTFDMSYSVFKNLPEKRQILEKLMVRYCERRCKLYDSLGYSYITVQALYDNGVSRKKGSSAINKLTDILKETFKNISHINSLDTLNVPIGYFLSDSKDKQLFVKFCNKLNIKHEYGTGNQAKQPDLVLKVKNDFFIIEAKHIKEGGGAQDKQVGELIEFIKYSENSDKIHYVAFLDGGYFNNFIKANKTIDSKINMQKRDIELFLDKNKNNFFVNTEGLRTLLKDLFDANNK